MSHDAEIKAAALEPVDFERLYANYLKTCAMSGIEPTPREQALGLVQEWTNTLAASRADRSTTH